MLGGTPYAVTTLLGALLHDVVARVTETEGAKPDSVVLTHPANWGPFRRELFDEVPQVAGLTAPRTITEPEAAAAHYAASRHLADGEIIAVYDLGGGTFDATVLRKHAGGIEILGVPEGIERLGGVDFDEAILSHVNYAASGALSELDMSDAADRRSRWPGCARTACWPRRRSRSTPRRPSRCSCPTATSTCS